MHIERTCRQCRRKTRSTGMVPEFCRHCGAAFGPIAFGLDHDLSMPTGLTQKEKDAELERRLRRT